MIEPNCDMPWEIYLDWLQDQGNEDLRVVDAASLSSSDYYSGQLIIAENFLASHFAGEGYGAGYYHSGSINFRQWSDWIEDLEMGGGCDYVDFLEGVHITGVSCDYYGADWYLEDGDFRGNG